MSSLAYFVGTFPTPSETFVYREVHELRSRGWRVNVVGLRRAPTPISDDLLALQTGTIVLYGQPMQFIARVMAELFYQPLRSLSTLCAALADAVFPGETLSLTNRIKILAQGLMGISAAHSLRSLKVNHVHCHFAHGPTSGGMYAAAQLGVPFSFAGHANDLFQRRSLLKRKLQRAAFVSCISEWHADFYEQVHPDDSGKYHVIRCGVPVDSWSPGLRGNGDGTLKILTVGRLVEKKGIDTLLRALAVWAKDSQLPWQLTVAGDGPSRSELETLSKALQISDRVDWLGSTGNAQVCELMQSADIFALPCKMDRNGDRDGIPVVVMEAMACGLPVVVGDLPAIRELVSNHQTGLLCDGADPLSVAECLKHLAESRLLRERLGAAGRQRVIDEFSLERNMDRLETALVGYLTTNREDSRELVTA